MRTSYKPRKKTSLMEYWIFASFGIGVLVELSILIGGFCYMIDIARWWR